MVTINVAEAKANLSKYLELVERGERVVICRRNVPIVELRRAKAEFQGEPRPLGFMTDWVISGQESLDEPWSDEDLGCWEQRP
ncbi:MAG: hypothetical protein AMXMBFR81_16810 [Chthonomonas sp.]|nr:type II toxin-antitoxin system prevent-host-death family antitoxin [Fimbriimonadaceae bacterium]